MGDPTLATGDTSMRGRTKEGYIVEMKVLHMAFHKFPAGSTGGGSNIGHGLVFNLHSHRDSGVPIAGPNVWQERGCPAQHISATRRSFGP